MYPVSCDIKMGMIHELSSLVSLFTILQLQDLNDTDAAKNGIDIYSNGRCQQVIYETYNDFSNLF